MFFSDLARTSRTSELSMMASERHSLDVQMSRRSSRIDVCGDAREDMFWSENYKDSCNMEEHKMLCSLSKLILRPHFCEYIYFLNYYKNIGIYLLHKVYSISSSKSDIFIIKVNKIVIS